jgi:acyl-CoA reductase-like NAD-dependent aldehyde dehydrogenase
MYELAINIYHRWNAALFLALKAISTPLAMGCTVVLKASEQSPRTHHYLVSLFYKAGFPTGSINVIQASREDAAAVTEAAISHPGIRKVEFIGSAGVGRHIASLAGKYLKPVMFELGGKNSAIVLEDADLHLAAQSAVMGALVHHGQVCFAVDVVIVQRSIYPQLLEELKAAMGSFPTHPAIAAAGPARTKKLVEEAVSQGAEILYGENELMNDYTLHPMILGNVHPESVIFDEESFGPTMYIQVVDTDEQTIAFANSSQYGLGSAVFSKDIGRALQIAKQIEAGQTNINWPYGAGSVDGE